MPAQLSLAVVGAQHPNRKGPTRLFEIRLCTPGEPVHLIPEPKNPADPRAVAVFSARKIQIGYLTAERAPWIGNMMAQGRDVRAIFQQATTSGAVIRASLDGSEPILPVPLQTQPPADPDFWPDWIPPDD
ncbi:hypothetical protein BH11PSE5_BH11PSE5_30680 [soil metagenome]